MYVLSGRRGEGCGVTVWMCVCGCGCNCVGEGVCGWWKGECVCEGAIVCVCVGGGVRRVCGLG